MRTSVRTRAIAIVVALSCSLLGFTSRHARRAPEATTCAMLVVWVGTWPVNVLPAPCSGGICVGSLRDPGSIVSVESLVCAV